MIHVKKAFVIGYPIKHSRSPLIHGHWLAEHGIAGSYEPIEVAPAELPAFLDRIRSGEFVGGNVTVPHKEDAWKLVDFRDVDTDHLKAFNTLSQQPTADGIAIYGQNTDLYGFLANLDQQARLGHRYRQRARAGCRWCGTGRRGGLGAACLGQRTRSQSHG